MQTIVTTTYTDAEFDAKIFSAVTQALQMSGLAIRRQEEKPSKIPVDIKRACEITGLSKPTIYALAPKGKIPNFKTGKKLLFFEEELLKWIQSGKRLTQSEIDERADNSLKAVKAN